MLLMFTQVWALGPIRLSLPASAQVNCAGAAAVYASGE